MDSSDGRGPALVAAIEARTTEIVAALGGLDDTGLDAPSELAGWSRLTIACHLRYGAQSLHRMTVDARAGRPASYYPAGRLGQRPGTLVATAGETPGDVVESLDAESRRLTRAWSQPVGADWAVMVTEPDDNPDLGPLPLVRLALMRLTEVEVHGCDLGLGLGGWSEIFVDAALPFRLDWLNRRRANHREFDAGLMGSWLLIATDGPITQITVSGTGVRSVPARRDTPATATIEGSSRDILALLLGRPTTMPLARGGDISFANAFSRALPGP